MPAVRFDPAVPIEIDLSFDSPQAVSYVLFQKPAGGSFAMFASGTDEEGVQVSGHHHELQLADGGTVKYRLIFAGNPNSPIKAQVAFKQNGVAIDGAAFNEGGACDADGVAVRSAEVTFHA